MGTFRTIKVGTMSMPIYCKRFLVLKKYCDIECDIACQLNTKVGSKVRYSFSNIIEEFRITSNQGKCALHDGVIGAEILQRGSRQVMFLSKDEVAAKLDTIRSYPRMSAAEIEREERYKNNFKLKLEKNSILTENLSDDLCSLTKASLEFGISTSKLYTALEHGIIHSRPKNGATKYLLSRSEITNNLELIKKANKFFYRVLNMKKQKEGQIFHQQMDKTVPVSVDSCNLGICNINPLQSKT